MVAGEVTVLTEDGISNFGALQNWRSEADGELYYYIFDILWLDGKDLTGLPLNGFYAFAMGRSKERVTDKRFQYP